MHLHLHLHLHLQGEVADIYLPDFATSTVVLALAVVYTGAALAPSSLGLQGAEQVLGLLGFQEVRLVNPQVKKIKKKVKVKLKVKHEKNLGSRKASEVRFDVSFTYFLSLNLPSPDETSSEEEEGVDGKPHT